MPAKSKRSYSKSINSYQYWVSRIAKTKAAEKKKSSERETRKSAVEPTSEEVVVTHGPRKPEVLDPLNLATKINAPKKQTSPKQLLTTTPSSTPPVTPSAGASLQENLVRAKELYGQLSPYAQHSGGNLDWMPIGTEPSSSDPEHPHTISVNRYGELGCDCRGYIFHKGPEGKTCTHCKEFAAEHN